MERFREFSSSSKVWSAVGDGSRAVRHIGIVLFNGFTLEEAINIGQAFRSANALSESCARGAVRYDVCLLSSAGGMIPSSSSVFVWTDSVEARREADGFHALFVVGGAGARSALRDERLIAWLRCAIPRSKRTFPISEGRSLLEAAGLGQSAFVRAHGEGGEDVAGTCYGADDYADDVGPLRSALNVIQEDLGASVTRRVAADIAPPVETPFTSIVRKNAALNVNERIQASARWIAENGEREITIDKAAQVAAMSERNFLRRFKAEMGMTPSDYLLYVRLDMCCRLLIETELPIDKIAHRSGIRGGGRLSKIFRKHLATTPTAYRANNRRAMIGL